MPAGSVPATGATAPEQSSHDTSGDISPYPSLPGCRYGQSDYTASNSTLQGARVLWVKVAPPTPTKSLETAARGPCRGVVC